MKYFFEGCLLVLTIAVGMLIGVSIGPRENKAQAFCVVLGERPTQVKGVTMEVTPAGCLVIKDEKGQITEAACMPMSPIVASRGECR